MLGVIGFATIFTATFVGGTLESVSVVYGIIGLGLFVGLIWLAASELGGTAVILQDRRNIFWGINRGFRQLFKNLIQTMGFYLFALIALLLTHALFRWVINPTIPLTWWHLLLIVSQLFVVIRLWLRVVRFGGTVSLLEENLFSQEPEDDVYADGEQNGENDGGSDWGVEGEVAALDGDVAGQTA